MASIDDALHRLEVALALLEGAVTRRVEADEARGDRQTELALLEDDRTRLAAELDRVQAELGRVATVTVDVSGRLGRAIGVVEGVLGDGSRRPID